MAKDDELGIVTRQESFNYNVVRCFALGFAVCSLLFGFLLRFMSEVPCDKPPSVRVVSNCHDYNKMIIAALRQSQAQVQDFNDDGLVNCLDYACAFKAVWDRMYPGLENYCELVRNKNPIRGMNHLFAQIRDKYGVVFEVEPWAANPILYSMKSNWPDDKYDPKFNIYGETEYWMRKCGLW